MTKDAFGDSLKELEMEEAGRKAMPHVPLIARIDGRSFHTYTKGLKRPYDPNLMQCMLKTTESLVKEFNACIGYTQSDEITLIWPEPIDFGRRLQKYTSLLAGHTSAVFARQADILLPQKKDKVPIFDCRVWSVPNQKMAVDILCWRQMDAMKNSVAMAAQSMYSHKQLQNKNRSDMMDMLYDKGINWNDYPPQFKRGIFVKRINFMRHLAPEELAKIPESKRPNGPVQRSRVEGVPEIDILRCSSPESLVDATGLVFDPYWE